MTIRSSLIAAAGLLLGILAPVVVPSSGQAVPSGPSCSSSGPVTVDGLTFDDGCVTVDLVDLDNER